VDIIATSGGSLATQAAKAATGKIPIVFIMGDADPVQAGFVASLGKPGGNMTGISLMGAALGPKRVEILREIAPQATAIAALIQPGEPRIPSRTPRTWRAPSERPGSGP